MNLDVVKYENGSYGLIPQAVDWNGGYVIAIRQASNDLNYTIVDKLTIPDSNLTLGKIKAAFLVWIVRNLEDFSCVNLTVDELFRVNLDKFALTF